MKKYIQLSLTVVLFVIGSRQMMFAQKNETIPKFYLGVAYGTSFAIGDFSDTDITNREAGFAKNGQRFDLYGGYFLDKRERTTVTGVFRYQRFETEIEDLVADYRASNPSLELTGATEDWRTYSFLMGLAYRVPVGKKFAFFPRAALGPMWATTPGIKLSASNTSFSNVFERNADTGLGLGYEVGIGLQNKLGKHFALFPTFTISGGWITIKDVVTNTQNAVVKSDYQPKIQSFNIGLSLAYLFY